MSKVIFVSNYLGNGGAGRVISVIADYFIDKGVETCLAVYHSDENEYKINPQIEKIEVKKSLPGLLGKMQRISRLRSLLNKNKDTTVIAFEYFVNIETIIAAMGLPNKVIISERNDPMQLDSHKVYKLLRDILYKYADVLICQTDCSKEYFPGFVQSHAVVIPNPITSGLPIGSGKNEKELVTFCRITKQKNLKMMIDAFALVLQSHPGYYLSIYGDGDEKEELIGYCESNGLYNNISFYPFNMDIYDKVKECLLFLSSSDYEGLSNSMLEAMAMGIPCVCTDCDGGGARMIIKDKVNGMIVPKNDTIAFANAINYLLDNQEERLKIRLNALKIRDELSVDRIGAEWYKLI